MSQSAHESVLSIFTSLSFIDSLPFKRSRGGLPAAVLSEDAEFEQRCIREAEDHEIGLFTVEGSHQKDSTSSSNNASGAVGAAAGHGTNSKGGKSLGSFGDVGLDENRLRRSLLGRSANGNNNRQLRGNNNGAWQLARRKGPTRISNTTQATPLRKPRKRASATAPRGQGGAVDFEDPEPFLLAAQRLLEHYPMQRASEHVELLHSQYQGLVDAIADLEETLSKGDGDGSGQVGSGQKPFNVRAPTTSAADELAQLEADIKREELEILALKELKAEREKESRDLDSQLREKRMPTASKYQRHKQGFQQPMPVAGHQALASDRTGKYPSASAVPSSSSVPARRIPAVVAQKMAREAESKAAAATAPAAVAARHPNTAPREDVREEEERGIESARSSTSPVEPPSQGMTDQEDHTNDPTGTTATCADDPDATPRKPVPAKAADTAATNGPVAMKPIVPHDHLQSILSKIASALPGESDGGTQDAKTMLSRLSELATPKRDPSNPLGSPASSVSTLTFASAPSEGSSGTTQSITPAQTIEYRLLQTFLALLLGSSNNGGMSGPAEGSTSLEVVMKGSIVRGDEIKEAMLPMTALKTYLGKAARHQGWNEDLGTKAIYSLVAKRVLRIDRRGREALVCFTA